MTDKTRRREGGEGKRRGDERKIVGTKEEKEVNHGASQGRSKARNERAIKKEKQRRGKARGRKKKRRDGSRMRRQCSRQPNHGPSPLVGMLPDWTMAGGHFIVSPLLFIPSNPPMEVFHDCHPGPGLAWVVPREGQWWRASI